MDTGTGALVVGGTAALLCALAWAAGRVPSPVWRSHLLAAAAGIAFGVASATAKTVIAVAADGGAVPALAHPAAGGTALLAVAGLLLAQAAYQGAELGAPLGVTTVANPVAASVAGVAFMGETYSGGWPGTGVAVLCALLAGYGIALLADPFRAGRTRSSRPSPALSDTCCR